MNVQEKYDCGHISKYYSKDRGDFTPSSIEELKARYGFIGEALEKILLGRINNKIAVFKNLKDDDGFSVALFTERHEYYISIRKNYLGCVYENRYYEPLEDWQRGGDLSDGKCTPETLNRIFNSIIYNELVYVEDNKKPPTKVFETSGTVSDTGMGLTVSDNNKPTVLVK